MSRTPVVALLGLVPVLALAAPKPDRGNAGGLPQCQVDLAESIATCDLLVADLLDHLEALAQECALDAATVTAAGGGTVTSADGGALVSFPPGALAKDTVVTVVKSSKPPPGDRASAVYDFGPNGTFAKDATICLAADVPAGRPSCLGYYDTDTSTWTCEDACLESSSPEQVCGTTSHFTSFAVLLSGTGTGKGCEKDDDDGPSWLGGATRTTVADGAIAIGGDGLELADAASLGLVDATLKVTGGTLTLGGSSTVDLVDSDLTITGGSLQLRDDALLIGTGSSIAVSGGSIDLYGRSSLRLIGQEGTRVRTLRERSVRLDDASMLTIRPQGADVAPSVRAPGGGDLMAHELAHVVQSRTELALGTGDTLDVGGVVLDASGLSKLLAACPRTIRLRAADGTATCEAERAPKDPACSKPPPVRAPSTSECEVLFDMIDPQG